MSAAQESDPAVPIEDQIKCVRREIALRRNVYRSRVEAGKMEPAEARRELDAMRAVLHTLEQAEQACYDLYAALWPPGAPAEDAADERTRVLAEITAMLETVEAERESGASSEDCLGPCELLVGSGAIPEAAHEFARVAALAVCRGATVPEAAEQAKAQTAGAAQ